MIECHEHPGAFHLPNKKCVMCMRMWKEEEKKAQQERHDKDNNTKDEKSKKKNKKKQGSFRICALDL